MNRSQDHQEALKHLVEELAASFYPRTDQLARWDGDLRASQCLETQLAEAGLYGIGMGTDDAQDGTTADLGIVLTSLGHHLAPASLLTTSLIVGPALASSQSDVVQEALDEMRSGSVRAAFVAPSVSSEKVTREDTDSGHVLTGEVRGVLEGVGADEFLVHSLDARGVPTVTLVSSSATGVTIRASEMVDRSRSWATVAFEAVEVPSSRTIAEGEAAGRCVRDAQLRAAAGIACDSLGVAEQSFAMTLDFVKQREQFGRAIGSFQAVKHRLVDQYSKLVGARACVRKVLTDLSGSEADSRSTHVAKAYATSSAVEMAGEMVQLHGAMGFTWELGAHALQKRALMNAHIFGDSAWHARQYSTLQAESHAVGAR